MKLLSLLSIIAASVFSSIVAPVSSLCDSNRVVVGGRTFSVPNILVDYPDSTLAKSISGGNNVWECNPEKEPVNIPGNSDIFHLVLELMHYGNIVLPLTGKINISHVHFHSWILSDH